MKRNITHVQPPLDFIPPNLQPGLVKFAGGLVPAILKYKLGIVEVEAKGTERLVELYRDFQGGKTRFMIAFRHPSADDPLALYSLLSQSVPTAARKMGVSLNSPTHAYYLYDRGVPLWAGRTVAWLLPRTGGISLQRGKLDRQSLKTARDKFANGDQPMMVAPEGATNGLSEYVSPLEPGIAQMAFWCLEDLKTANRPEKVYLVPLGLKYSYVEPPWEGVDNLLSMLETECGIVVSSQLERYARLTQIGENLLEQLEGYYSRFHRQEVIKESSNIGERLRNLLENALLTSEEFFGLQPKGTPADRCRRVEQAGWDRIYREDLKGQPLSPVQKGLADRVAEEADSRMWHMRIVEAFVSVTGNYVREKPTADRFAETAGLLYKTAQRLKGVDLISMPKLGKRKALVAVGEPILINKLFPAYQENRQNARKTVSDLTQSLQKKLEEMAVATE